MSQREAKLAQTKGGKQPVKTDKKKEKPKAEKQEKPRTNTDDQKRKKELEKLESRISVLEEQVGKYETEMSDPVVYENADGFQELNKNYQEKKSELDRLMARWEKMG